MEILRKIDKIEAIKDTFVDFESIMNKYFTQVYKDGNKGLNFKDAIITNLVVAESYSLLSNKDKVDEFIFQNMLIIKDKLLNKNLYGKIFLYDGLTEIALSTYAIYNNTRYYKKFLNKLNELLLDWVKSYLNHYDIKNNLYTEHFDIISGISGVANYLLLFEKYEEYNEVIKELLEILVYISGYTKKSSDQIPRWHIKNENLIMENDRINFPRGNINFGLAHGIAGPLVVLSRAYKKHIRVEGQLDAINNIINEYKKFAYTVNGSTYWPGKFSLENYLLSSEDYNYRMNRESWCYGAIGIARALFIAGNCIKDNTLSGWAYNIIEQKSQLKIEDLLLDSPTLCHGYAGVLSILNSTNRDRPSSSISCGINKIECQIKKMYDSTTKYGFLDVETKHDNGEIKTIKEDRNTFLDGSAGVILALLSLNSDEQLAFENKLLI